MKRTCVFAILAGVPLFGAIAVAQESQSKSDTGNQAAKAVVPRLIRFGGVLKDSGAKPLHGAQDVTFSLYAIEAGGEPLWFETQTVEADAQGRYSILLGAMHPEGLPMDLFTSGEARWLGVSVGKLPEQARVLLVAVPYALKAADADTLGGKPATAFVASDQLKDQVQSVVNAQAAQSGTTTRTLVGTAPAPQAMGEPPSSFVCAVGTDCVAVSQTGSGVGLHATTPTGTSVLGELSGTSGAAVFGRATAATGAANAVQGDSASTGGVGVLGRAAAATGLNRGVFGRSFSTSGIGVHGDATTTTGATRGVWGTAASTGGVGVYGQSSNPSGFTTGVTGTVASTAGVAIFGQAGAVSGSTVGVLAKVTSASGTAIVADNISGGKIFSGQVSGVEKASISGTGTLTLPTNGLVAGTNQLVLSGGNVGIGTATPAAKLEVNGTGNFTGNNTTAILTSAQANSVATFPSDPSQIPSAVYGNSTATSDYAAGINGYSSSPHGFGVLGVAVEGTGVAGVTTGTTPYFNAVAAASLATTGNPIALTADVKSPTGMAAHFSGVAGATLIQADVRAGSLDTTVFKVDTSGNVLLAATGGGKVGIGTNVPGQKLEVNGGVRLNTLTLKPACNSTTRGTMWLVQGGATVADTLEVCVKNGTDNFEWKSII